MADEVEPDEMATVAPEEMHLVKHIDVAVGNIGLYDRDDPDHIAEPFDRNVIVMRIKADKIGSDGQSLEPTTFFFVLDPKQAASKALDMLTESAAAMIKKPLSKERMQELIKTGIRPK